MLTPVWDVLSVEHLRDFEVMYARVGSGRHRLILGPPPLTDSSYLPWTLPANLAIATNT